MYNKIFKSLVVVFLGLFTINTNGQELKCRISVNTTKIQRTDKQIFQTLQTALYEFMNNRIWTNNVFSYKERIECDIFITLETQLNPNEWKGQMQIQSSRPVYNSSYNSLVFKHLDADIQFSYVENEILEFNINSHTSNLTSLLAYYAYIIIGIDYDTFGNEGGTQFFQKAEQIVTNAQAGAKEKGWKQFESTDRKNRYWLVNNLLDDKYRNVREFNYKYHRLGLDIMSEKPVEGRTQIEESIKLLQALYRRRPDPFMFLLNVELNTKANEFVDIFSEAPMDQKSRVARMLKEIDPTNNVYDNLTKQN